MCRNVVEICDPQTQEWWVCARFRTNGDTWWFADHLRRHGCRVKVTIRMGKHTRVQVLEPVKSEEAA